MAIGLLVSLFAAFYLLLAPTGEYGVSPASLAVDALRRQLNLRVAGGSKGAMLGIIGRSMADVVKSGVVAGSGLALITFLISVKLLGPWSLVVSVAAALLGIGITGKMVTNEYLHWQNRLVDGIPALVNFMPAFLEVEGVTAREALGHTITFLPEPLKHEMGSVLDKIRRTGRVREAMDAFAGRARHPLVDAICFRISSAWDAKITSDIFADLADQVDDTNELTVARSTAAKTGYLALVSVLGLIGMMLVYGYPGLMFLAGRLSEGFGG